MARPEPLRGKQTSTTAEVAKALLQSSLGHGPVVIAMVAVRMVQVSIHQIIDMVAMRYCVMTATGTVHMRGVVCTAFMIRCATVRIGARYLDHVLIDVIAMGVVQVPVVQIVDVAVMADGRMTATRTVGVRMRRVRRVGACRHIQALLFLLSGTELICRSRRQSIDSRPSAKS